MLGFRQDLQAMLFPIGYGYSGPSFQMIFVTRVESKDMAKCQSMVAFAANMGKHTCKQATAKEDGYITDWL